MLIVLDVDYTLLDTAALKQAMRSAVAPLGVTREIFDDTYKRVVQMVPNAYNYDVEQHGRFLAKYVSTPSSDLTKALHAVLDRTKDFLYPEVSATLKRWHEEGHAQVIFTRGNPKWQEKKIEQAGLLQYIDDIYCIDDEKHNMALHYNIPESSWVFVNDNPREVVHCQRQYPSARVVRLRRAIGKTYREEDERYYETHTRDHDVVTSLRELTL